MKEIIAGILILITAIGVIYLLSRVQMMGWLHQAEKFLKNEYNLKSQGDIKNRQKEGNGGA